MKKESLRARREFLIIKSGKGENVFAGLQSPQLCFYNHAKKKRADSDVTITRHDYINSSAPHTEVDTAQWIPHHHVPSSTAVSLEVAPRVADLLLII